MNGPAVTISAQMSAVETMRRILLGGVKLPRPNGTQARYLADQLDAALITISSHDTRSRKEVAIDELAERERRIIKLCQQGALLCKVTRSTIAVGKNPEPGFFLTPTNETVPRAVAEAVIATPFMRPNEDGLFGSEYSQTWRAA